jgi:Arm DNA-binding domain
MRVVAGSVRRDNTAEDRADNSVLPSGATDQKVGGSTPSERAELVQVTAGLRVVTGRSPGLLANGCEQRSAGNLSRRALAVRSSLAEERMRGSVVKRGNTWSYVVDVGRDPMSGRRRQRWKGGFPTKREAERESVARWRPWVQARFPTRGASLSVCTSTSGSPGMHNR